MVGDHISRGAIFLLLMIQDDYGDACHQDGDGVDQWDHQDQDHD